MTDLLERLEHELESLRPAPLSDRMVDAIVDELASARPLGWGDRCLLAAMSAGSLAACVIVGLVAWQVVANEPRGASRPPPSVVAVQSPVNAIALTPPPATLGQYQQALARAGDAIPEVIR